MMIETGLFLPLRFYLNESEQDRKKRYAKGVALTEYNYLVASCKSLAPFQVRYVSDVLADMISLYIVCAYENTATKLPFNAAAREEVLSPNGYYYLSYLGNDDFSVAIGNGLYYLRLEVTFGSTTITWYSDLFIVKDCDNIEFDDVEYRSYSPFSTDLRAVDISELRITK